LAHCSARIVWIRASSTWAIANSFAEIRRSSVACSVTSNSAIALTLDRAEDQAAPAATGHGGRRCGWIFAFQPPFWVRCCVWHWRGWPRFAFACQRSAPISYESALGESHPVYAIDLEWLCESRLHFTIEQIAEFCLDAIYTKQPYGPYEVARPLSSRDRAAALVALLDAPNPALMKDLSQAASAQFSEAYLIDRIKKYLLHLR